jgi:hypothetical protein
MDSPDHRTDPGLTAGEVDEDAEAEADADLPEVLTLGEILPFSQYRVVVGEWEKPPSDRVQYAMDMALIAAAERVIRMLRADLTDD